MQASISRRTATTAIDTPSSQDGGPKPGGGDETVKAAAPDQNVTSVPLGQLSELMSKSAESVLEYFEARVILILLPLEMLASASHIICIKLAQHLDSMRSRLCPIMNLQ